MYSIYVCKYLNNLLQQVVACLSEVVRNDTINDSKHKVTKPCRQQLRAQLLQQREFLELDPVLKNACQGDISKHCSGMESGSAQVNISYFQKKYIYFLPLIHFLYFYLI